MLQLLGSGLVGRVLAFLGLASLLLMTIPASAQANDFDLQKLEASDYKIFATPKGSNGTGFLVSGQRTVALDCCLPPHLS
jgi:hypothetical protein